jgi:hypothetical protein
VFFWRASSPVGDTGRRQTSLSHESERGEPSTNGSKASPLRRSVEGLAASGPGSGTVEQTAEAIGEAANVLAVTAEEVLGSDDLLLTEEVRQAAAQVSDEHPLGVPGRPLGERSPLRLGFSVGIGLLLAAATAEVVILAGHVLILLVIAVFIAVSLEPVVGFLCRRGLRRGLAVAAVVVVGLVLTALFLDNVVPLTVSEASQVTHRLPAFLHELQSKNSEIGRQVEVLPPSQGPRASASPSHPRVGVVDFEGYMTLPAQQTRYSLTIVVGVQDGACVDLVDAGPR